MRSEEQALDQALREVIMMAELRPALDILAHGTASLHAEYFRFPRYSTGALGAAVLCAAAQLKKTLGAWSAKKPPFCRERLLDADHLLFFPLAETAFGERDSAGIVVGRSKSSYGNKERSKLTKYAPLWSAAHHRIRKFEGLIDQRNGLMALIETRLNACAVLAHARGDVVWMSESARDALGDEGKVILEERLRAAIGEVARDVSHTPKEFIVSVPGKHRLFGAMSFVRESRDASVHYIAVELYGSEVDEAADEFKLTSSEREVYKRLKHGLSNEEIAQARFVSVETVRTHVKSIFRKLGVSSRLELVTRRTPSP